MEVKDVLSLMIQFGAFLITLIGLVITIVTTLNQNKKK
ncbi:MAG: putative holin-like toxin [Paenibacillus macerans]|nr:putative holin-like toxin [Paenibacillus macerans]MCY7557402.1 putative holin-like toxin [Paenibacillus macerans]MDU5945718.1 putative holin-like toxin [Paenibacillus macerans]MDU7476491.1 putative holin-like toxin [Paenibacillus macerans]MEC0135898.1 putative holin-like toxin [Paenibacillus macerans]MEC0154251.1 putative holin-like toxin [Paenibacillus macerans]